MSQVFVYGTLRTGASNAFRMKGASSLGSATVSAKLYRVHDDFPGIVLSNNSEDVLLGEVFTGVSNEHLHALDVYEGCDAQMPVSERIYRRILAPVILESGEVAEAFIWEYIREVDERERIVSGDWLAQSI